MAQITDVKDKYEILLDELSQSRQALVNMMEDIDKCKNAVLGTASNTTDYRSRYAKEDRIKTIASFYSTALSVRQEYNRNIISEIELRRKLEKGDDGTIELDIVKIAKQLEKAKKDSEKKVESIAEVAKKIESGS